MDQVQKESIQLFVSKLKNQGIFEVPSTGLFDWCLHVAIQVEGLDGVGIIHQDNQSKSLNLCVFERSEGLGGWTEIFERQLTKLAELPEKVEEWRCFRATEASQHIGEELGKYNKWLRSVATCKLKKNASIREARIHLQEGDSLSAWTIAGFDLSIDLPLLRDTPPLAKQRLSSDFQAIAPDLLAWHLPLDDKGKPLLKRRVPLFRYDYDSKRRSWFCLLVAMPERRSGRPEIRCEWLQADNQTARLDTAKELFDTRLISEFTSEFIGIPKAKVKTLLNSGVQKDSVTRVAQIIQLQEEGQFEAAMQLADIKYDKILFDCLQQKRVTHMCSCCASLDKQLVEWSNFTFQTLIRLNISRFIALALRDEQRCKRKPRAEPIPLLPLPLQRHARKAHLALSVSKSSPPCLTIDFTGSGRKLPLALWKRPVDIDLLRGGYLKVVDLPESVGMQFGLEKAL